MKKFLLLCLMTLGMATTALAQSMTESQILQFVQQEKKKGTSESDIATKLLQKGATLQQIQQMRQKYASQLEKTSQPTGPLVMPRTACARTMVPCGRSTTPPRV